MRSGFAISTNFILSPTTKKSMNIAVQSSSALSLKDILDQVVDDGEEEIVHAIMLDRAAAVHEQMVEKKMCTFDSFSGRLASVFFAAKMESQDWGDNCASLLFHNTRVSLRAAPHEVARLEIRLACEAAHTWWYNIQGKEKPSRPSSGDETFSLDSENEEGLFLC